MCEGETGHLRRRRHVTTELRPVCPGRERVRGHGDEDEDNKSAVRLHRLLLSVTHLGPRSLFKLSQPTSRENGHVGDGDDGHDESEHEQPPLDRVPVAAIERFRPDIAKIEIRERAR